jgi:hypothetical protein
MTCIYVLQSLNLEEAKAYYNPPRIDAPKGSMQAKKGPCRQHSKITEKKAYP